MPMQEVHTVFGFQFDRNKLAAVERGVKRTATNLNTAAHHVDAFQARMGGAFTRLKQMAGAYLGFRAVQSMTTGYAQKADEIAKFSKAINVSTEAYQGLTHAAELNGATEEVMMKALPQLAKRAGEAADGQKKQASAYRALGVEVRGANGMLKSADVLFLEVADGMVNLKDKNKRAQIAMDLFGRTGAQLMPTFLNGSKAIRQMMLEAKKLGRVLTKEQLKAAENFNDEMLRVKSVLKGVRNQIASKLLPAITKQLKAFQMWWREGRNAERAMRALKLTAIFTTIVLAKMIAVKTVKTVRSFVKGIWHGVRALQAMNFQAAIAQIKLLLVFGAVALMALAIEDLIGFAQGKDSVIGRLLGDTDQAAALKAAIIGIARAAVNAWTEMKPALLATWADLKPVIADLWNTIKPMIGPAFKTGVWIMIAGFKALRLVIQQAGTAIKVTSSLFGFWAKGAAAQLKPILTVFKTILGFANRALYAMSLLTGSVELSSQIKEYMQVVGGYSTDVNGNLILPSAGGPGPSVRPAAAGVGGNSTTSIHIGNGAIQVPVNATGDAKQIAAQISQQLGIGINRVFTDASRNLKPPPRGQR